ncbi:MAG: hypothetical protein ACD_17C00505G0002 [uncultured bacterium]|nr:MAG: hypothetical protein ACD_17C00505G0002 [uncultured bacterium]OGN55987.1 MAG: hypothetical protein A2796_00385 [Chlamydiae bacterium RIFCSPHIGHO2_01_FULL_44_39]OGN56728.1 MAG: hypothetical protein A3C42_06155 [Chlamydiae bacterium RIFCSPHIGHO2_02_FULL_45_9]OGN60600.1 MAG: hypothetical protein A3D96_03320 [Chlamydiae bacterium RIFCSPHIGHO2_12_FULL_44_59]OGN66416.1 MAG: hypothetical protein A2978_03835 [Chlamydiae bacterium RIFCSPLOWO2_01_FULL_44_52]OGN69467.1 MAG: hypothetical protein A3
MIRILFFLLLVPFLAFADPNQLFSENEDPAIFHHVNVITGHLNISFQDAVIQGAQPIPIPRTYSSSGALERTSKNFDLILRAIRGGWLVQGGWNLLPHTNLLIETHYDRKEFKVYLPEPSGSMIPYAYSHKSSKHTIFLKPTNSVSKASGKLSSRTNSQNNLLEIDLKAGVATLFLPDGGKRVYRGPSLHEYNQNSLGKAFYLLDTEGQQQILQKILHIFAVGPAESLSQKQGVSVINVYSEKDYITGFGPCGYAKRFMDNPNYDIRVLSCISGRGDKNLWIADHGFLKPTYHKAWGDHIDYLKENFRFYGGSKHDSTR